MKYRISKYWIAACLLIGALYANAASPPIEPFKATYAVTYRGLRAGNITFDLRRDGGNQYLYQSTVEPSFLARMIVNSNATEHTRFALTDAGVQPLDWKLDDGGRGTEKDGYLQFNHTAQRVVGVMKDKTVDFALEPHTQDRLSVQMEVMHRLLQGQPVGMIPLVDDERIKHYEYTRTGTERVKTPLGTFDCIVYESTRSGSSRISRMWHAPALGYIPVRAEQVRDGKVETIMQLAGLQGRKIDLKG